VGKHGIYITFPHPSLILSTSEDPSPVGTPAPTSNYFRGSRKSQFTATYLPQVAEEQGWDKVEAVDSAIQKAGWDGVITEELRRNVSLRRYQSRKCTVQWADFVDWRRERGGDI
jgi:AMME syndrome candidate gene 1 protein